MTATAEVTAPARVIPWERVGISVDGLMTAKEAIEKGSLDWRVVKEPMYIMGEGDKPIEVPDKLAIVRDVDQLVLGVVSPGYKELQNISGFEFMDALVDSGEAKYSSVGTLRGGKWVFMSVKFPKEILIGGEDPIDLYGVLWNSHDGSKAVTLMVTPIRPVCQNTLQLGLKHARSTFTVRHTTTMEGKLAEARRALELTYSAADEFQVDMDKLLSQKMTNAQFEKFVTNLTDLDTVTEKVKPGIIQTWETSETVDRATRYGAFNAVTEYVDWTREPRGANAQMMSTLFGQGMRLRNRAYELLSA